MSFRTNKNVPIDDYPSHRFWTKRTFLRRRDLDEQNNPVESFAQWSIK